MDSEKEKRLIHRQLLEYEIDVSIDALEIVKIELENKQQVSKRLLKQVIKNLLKVL